MKEKMAGKESKKGRTLVWEQTVKNSVRAGSADLILGVFGNMENRTVWAQVEGERCEVRRVGIWGQGSGRLTVKVDAFLRGFFRKRQNVCLPGGGLVN